MAGVGKRVVVYIPEMVESELMYKLFSDVVGNLTNVDFKPDLIDFTMEVGKKHK